MKRVFRRLIILFALSTVSIYAQRDLGTITGMVTDPQGTVVPNAKVTITEDATGLSYELQTGATGDYTRPLLKPGTYTITVEAPGSGVLLKKMSSAVAAIVSECLSR